MKGILKIPILGVTKEARIYEQNVIEYLRNSLLNSNLELIDISFYDSNNDSLNNAMDIIEESNKKVIFITDSSIGSTMEYEEATKAMFERGIRPFVFVTHVESAKYDLNEVAMLPTALEEYIDPKIDWYQYVFDSLFFNYRTKKYFKTAQGKEGDIDIFVNAINEYLSEK